MDTLLIKDPNSKEHNNNLIKKNKNLIIHEKEINELVKYSSINPPFFKKIIIQNENLNENDLKNIYNMCLKNGKIYFSSNYDNFFKSKRMITKESNFVYPINNRIVDFIIVGAQRSGTTSLSLNISKHPDIFINNNKDPKISEVHFFDINWKKGVSWYKKELKFNKNKNKVIGEKTPNLAYLSQTHSYMQSINPFLKLIFIIRNPVERAYSNWKLNIKNGSEKMPFTKAISYELKYLKNQNKTFHTSFKHYISKGFYYEQLKNLLKWFPKDNILVLISEKVKLNMNKEYNKVFNFLNLKELQNNKYELEYTSDDKSQIKPLLYKKLIKIYEKDIKSLEKLLNIKTDWI